MGLRPQERRIDPVASIFKLFLDGNWYTYAMARPKGSARVSAVQATQKQLDALNLRLKGLTYQEMGKELGVTAKTAHDRVLRALKHQREEFAEKADEVREQELARLDLLMQKVMDRAMALGDPKDIEAVLKIMDRRAKYLGIETTKIQVEARWADILQTHLEG